jgi:hypothetical protein
MRPACDIFKKKKKKKETYGGCSRPIPSIANYHTDFCTYEVVYCGHTNNQPSSSLSFPRGGEFAVRRHHLCPVVVDATPSQYDLRILDSQVRLERLQEVDKSKLNVTVYIAAGISYNAKGIFLFIVVPKS